MTTHLDLEVEVTERNGELTVELVHGEAMPPKPPREGLLPCPFCGSTTAMSLESSLEHAEDDDERTEQWQIVCDVHDDGCGCSTGWEFDSLESCKQWNRRAPHATPCHIPDSALSDKQRAHLRRLLGEEKERGDL